MKTDSSFAAPKLSRNMNLYLVERTDKYGYDEYTAFVVKCDSEQTARETHPAYDYTYDHSIKTWKDHEKLIGTNRYDRQGWVYGVDIDNLKITHVGMSDSDVRGVILSSFLNG